MGARIEAVAVTHGGILRHDALHLADRAARDCLERAGRRAGEIDLLINAGLYRKKSLAEPALAAIIQEDIGANPGHPPVRGHGTFSFDLANAGAGPLSAIFVLDGFLRSRAIALGMALASDSRPEHIERFPFDHAGGAVLLSAGRDGEGFESFSFRTFPEPTMDSRLGWNMAHAKNELSLRIDPSHARRCVEHAATTVSEMDAAGIDLLVASAVPNGFAQALADRLRIPRVAQARGFENAHTAGIFAALDAAMRDKSFQAASRTLFVTVGAGIVVGAALYQR
jgi:3-oxoacyl-[acyl-carrier-protein] synthase-3